MMLFRKILIKTIKGYQFLISPFFGGNNCRFYPSCSQYSIDAIEKFGICRGIFFTFFRIIRCNPFFKGGIDPVCRDSEDDGNRDSF